jgi:class 3 adenylate cyclase
MDEQNVIRFPTERRVQAAARALPEPGQAQAVPAEPQPEGTGEPFAFLSIEVRRLPRTESRIPGDVAGRILNRCVLAALEILSKERIPVDLAGTVLRPVIEASFHGDDGVQRAAEAALAVGRAVARSQREVENEFHVFGAITTGSVAALDSGVKVTTGSPEQIASRFREHAAPGQILLSEAAVRRAQDRVAVQKSAVPVAVPGRDPVESYPLTGLK